MYNFTFRWNLKNKRNKPKKKLIHTETRLVARGEGDREYVKWVKGVNCIVRDGNQTYCGGHFVVYTEIELLCCTLETTIIVYTNFTSIKDFKKAGGKQFSLGKASFLDSRPEWRDFCKSQGASQFW